MLVAAPGVFAEPVTNLLSSVVKKYFPGGASNLINAFASKYCKSVAANTPVLYGVASKLSPT